MPRETSLKPSINLGDPFCLRIEAEFLQDTRSRLHADRGCRSRITHQRFDRRDQRVLEKFSLDAEAEGIAEVYRRL